MILGPLLYKPENVNTSNMLVMSLMYGTAQSLPRLASYFIGGDSGATGITDIDDVTNALARAMSTEGAAGRYICMSFRLGRFGVCIYSQAAAGAIRTLRFPSCWLNCFLTSAWKWRRKEVKKSVRIEVRFCGLLTVVPVFKTDKIQKDLQIQFTPIRKTIQKAIDSLIQHQFVG